jgi:hypothetical protein
MKRSVLFLLAATLILTFAASIYAAPTAMPVTLGISPRDVAADTADIFRKVTTGMPNVGVGETIYLGQRPPMGEEEPEVLTGFTWEVTARPNNSQAQLSATDAAVVSFVPDLAGTYRFSLVVVSDSGRSEPATLTVNAANWVGTGNITGEPNVPECAACHNGQVDDKVAEVMETKHAHMFESMIGGARGYYRSSCVSCHTVGYNADQTAVNNGFDDVATAENWRFPSDTAAQNNETWNNMKRDYPNTAAMANISCENCHGPGSRHMGATGDSKTAISYSADMCAKCHDSGTHHFRPMQWKLSKHSAPVDESGRAACAPCHVGLGFVDKVAGLPDSLLRTEYVPITCITCHDPHDATNAHQIRTVASVTLANGEMYNAGYSNLCANCHHSRTDAEVSAAGSITSRYGPHHGPQSDMLKGTNAFDMGGEVENSPHYMVVENGCVGCHMAETPEDANDPETFLKLGDHTFAMKTEEGAEHVEACAACHGEIESFEDIMADDDWDGDGTTEGVKAELDGLMERLAIALPPADDPNIERRNRLTPTQRQALWNYMFVLEDKSGGMHNAKYAKSLLQNALNADLGVQLLDETIPANFSLSDAYPNPFNPVASFKYDLANEGDVDIRVFDMAGREIRQVVAENQKAGSYRAVIDLTGKPSGVYVLRMQAGSFDASKKLILVK